MQSPAEGCLWALRMRNSFLRGSIMVGYCFRFDSFSDRGGCYGKDTLISCMYE